MNYAPVIIPTLNRFDHFKQCIESLSACTWAEETEVYVGLDYPSKDSHWEGYNKIKDYLKSCGNLRFKELHVIIRPFNYGVGSSKEHLSNIEDLVQMIEKISDRYIFSEDDNVFSRNFLEYINKGLDKFKNDDSVFAIVGYCHPYPFKFSVNNYFRHQTDFSAWGYGIWTFKRQRAFDEYENSLFKKVPGFSLLKRFRYLGLNRLRNCLVAFWGKSNNKLRTDNNFSTYIQVANKVVILPSISKVRNTGWDGTGVHSGVYSMSDQKIADGHNYQIIDTADHFDYIGDGWTFFKDNNTIASKNSDGKISTCSFLRWLIFSFANKYLKIK